MDMSKDMEEEAILHRKSKAKGVNKESLKKSAMACESRKAMSSAKFMNACSDNMVMQVKTKQAKIKMAKSTKS